MYLILKRIRNFIQLLDVPSTYVGQALKHLRVNAGETALEFVSLTLTFLGLTDTPSSYSGQALNLVRVNAGEAALEFWTLLVNLATMVTGVLLTGNGGTGSSANANAANGVVVLDADSKLPANLIIGFSDTPVFNGTTPSIWTDLDLSSVVGVKRCLALLMITCSIQNQIVFRVKGETAAFGVSNASLGCSGVVVPAGGGGYVMALTNAAGIVQWGSLLNEGGTATIYVRGHTK